LDTLQFLEAILPAEGVYYVGVMRAGQPGVAHKPFTDLPTMAEYIVRADQPGVTVYHACSTYKEAYVEVDGKKKYRVSSNTKESKAFWADLDVGEAKAAAGKGYLTKTDAGKAIFGFCNETGFPPPMVVDSGNGLHCYWPFTEAIPAADWRVLADQFKAVLAHFGVLADPTRTADFASVMRPVGARNMKDPANPKPVKVLREAPARDVAVYMAALSNIVSNFGVKCDDVGLGALPEYMQAAAELNEDLTGHYPSLPVDAELVASKCAQVRLVKDTGGAEYEQWFKVVGILKHCEGGEGVAHLWSAQSPQYSRAETQQKLDTWNAGPSTCEAFGKINPSGCEGCPSKGKITSPIVLGRKEPEPVLDMVVDAVVDGKPVQALIPELTRSYAYDIGAKYMTRALKDKDGNLQLHKFSYLLFYPTTRICVEGGTFEVRVRVHKPDKTISDFDIPAGLIASGGVPLLQELGDHEIMPTTAMNKDAPTHITAYMQQSLQDLLTKTKQMNTMTTFGWKDHRTMFLIGDRLYHKDGTIHRVVLGGYALTRAVNFPEPRGTTQGWSEGVNHLYDRAGMAPMQYAVCSAFGSLLSPFGEELYHGIPVALTGSESGKGKTTACRAAMYAFGDASKLTINGTDGATINARGALMGCMNNLPILIDEITHIKAVDLSKLLYAASNGQDKERLKSGNHGTELAVAHTWDMSMFLTANKHLAGLLSSEQSNTEAEVVRFIEIQTDTYKTPIIEAADASATISKIARNAGAAGADFIPYLMQQLDTIEQRFADKGVKLAFSSAVSQNSKYRYYRQHAVCTLVAADMMQELGLVSFDLEALFDWIVAHISKICADVAEFNTVTGEDATQRMINDLSPLIITTASYKDTRLGVQVERTPKLHDAAVGRYIMGTTHGLEPRAGHLYVSKAAVRDWCLKNRVDRALLTDYLTSVGALLPISTDDKRGRFNITLGTENAPAQIPCWCIDTHRMNDSLAGVPLLTLHQGTVQDEDAA
jgi:hypothetical protein